MKLDKDTSFYIPAGSDSAAREKPRFPYFQEDLPQETHAGCEAFGDAVFSGAFRRRGFKKVAGSR